MKCNCFPFLVHCLLGFLRNNDTVAYQKDISATMHSIKGCIN